MKKYLLKIFGIIILAAVALLLSFKLYMESFFPPKHIAINHDNPQIAFVQINQMLNADKNQLRKNEKRFSGIDWENVKDKNANLSRKLAYINIFAYINDYVIAEINELIIGRALSLDYMLSASIKLKKFGDREGAKKDIDEFEQLIDENKCVYNYQDLKDMIKYFRKKNNL